MLYHFTLTISDVIKPEYTTESEDAPTPIRDVVIPPEVKAFDTDMLVDWWFLAAAFREEVDLATSNATGTQSGFWEARGRSRDDGFFSTP